MESEASENTPKAIWCCILQFAVDLRAHAEAAIGAADVQVMKLLTGW